MNVSNTNHDEEMISATPLYKTPPNPISRNPNNNNNSNHEDSMMDISARGGQPFETPNNNNNSHAPRDVRRPTLRHQHSYAGHEVAGQVVPPRAPSGRPFLATRHLSIEELDDDINSNSNVDAAGLDMAMMHDETPNPNNSNSTDHSFLLMPTNEHGFAMPAFTPTNTSNNNNNASTSTTAPTDDGQRQQPPQQPGSQPETAEERARREEEESIALAQMLMAEEAMASHRMSADFLRMNSDQFSAEDFAALQNALQEEDAEDDDDDQYLGDAGEDDEDDEGVDNMSYEALLQLGERMGDVKTDRWTMIAHKEIAKLETFQYDPAVTAAATGTGTAGAACCSNIDDSEIKCLVCQFAYEKGETLRRLPCKHCFHQECIDEWLKTKDICAYCRQSICTESEK